MATMKPNRTAEADALQRNLQYLKLSFTAENLEDFAKLAADQHWDPVTFLARLIEGDAARRLDRSVERRIRLARFPVLKTLENFQWNWPRKINRAQIQNLFRLKFLDDNANVVFIGGVGLGKSHLATALGLAACHQGHPVLFASTVDVINTLAGAQATGRLKSELRKYLRPRVLVLDEIGYLPIDKAGADLLFQVISQRYECGSIILTTNRVYKKWPEIFNNDATLTSAVLDRLLHHAETVTIEGKSYRMKDQIEDA
jgi:DNA replication protein DnaC